jgi:hypothetical protein
MNIPSLASDDGNSHQCWFLAWLILGPWRWRRHVSPKRRLTFDGIHDVISHKIELFITIAVRNWDPGQCWRSGFLTAWHFLIMQTNIYSKMFLCHGKRQLDVQWRQNDLPHDLSWPSEGRLCVSAWSEVAITSLETTGCRDKATELHSPLLYSGSHRITNWLTYQLTKFDLEERGGKFYRSVREIPRKF